MFHKFFKPALFVFCTGVLISLTAYVLPGDAIKGDWQQGLRAFEFLKKVRKDPNSFTERLRVSLKGIPAAPDLRWSDTLAAVAEQKALDMAQKDYFGSVDKDGYGINYYINKAGYRLDDEYLKHKRADDFEVFIGGYQSGEEAIGAMITDKDESDGASRKFLLGMTDFSKGLHDIGIGFVKGTKDTKYRFYTVVIITKHRS